jgi:hypothetical protein
MPIRRSVGDGGANLRGDVKFVQFLLNDWRSRNGLSTIKIDGLVGPETIDAITVFQGKVTGLIDGRVDPNGPALCNLERLHVAVMVAGFQWPEYKPFSSAEGLPQSFDAVEKLVRQYLVSLRNALG